MELKRRRDDEDPSGTNGESQSSSKRSRRSSATPKIALSDRTVKLLEEKVTFPSVSKCRRQNIRASILAISFECRDTYERPDTRAVSKEHKIGSYFDSQSPIYSESFVDVPKVEVGKKLNVLDLIGGNLLRFSTSTQNVPSILPTKSYRGSKPSMCMSKSGPGNVQRIQPPALRHCSHVDREGVLASTTSTATGSSLNVQRIQPFALRRCSHVDKEGVLASTTSTTTGKTENVTVESTLNLKGKYIMICCVFVPSIWCSDDGRMLYHTALASHELARRDDFELVVVPMMREGFTHSISAYNHFLSGFSCLAVPFDDSHRREFICSSLGFDGKINILILDPSQEVLDHGEPNMFHRFGGAEHDFFPFTPERQEIILDRDSVRENRSLDELLGLSDSDVLYNIDYLAGGRLRREDACITISELKKKVVWLFMYNKGRGLDRLREVAEECRRREYELEIVVVCHPFLGELPPKLHEEAVIDALASLKLLGWWLLPFNNTVCHRLERMCEIDGLEESVIIVDPNEKIVDPYGIQIMRDFGIDSYPFTRRSLIDKELQRKMGLRLISLLLPWGVVPAAINPEYSIDIPVAKLKGKIVLLYLYKEGMKYLADKLAAWYKNTIKGKYSNVVEIVAVSIDGSDTSEEYFYEKGWLVCRGFPHRSAKLCEQYWHPRLNPHEALVAFDEDGRITSLDPSHILQCQGPPFHGDLREEICRDFEGAGYLYMLH